MGKQKIFDSTNGQYLASKITSMISTKQDTLVSGENIKSLNGNSLLGNGNILSKKEDITYNKWVIVAVAGQSNAVGYDETAVRGIQYTPSDNNRIKQIGCWSDDTLDLINLDHCAHNIQNMSEFGTNGSKGVHLPLANLLLNYIPEDYGIIILPVAFGATGFVTRSILGTFNTTLLRPTSLTDQLSWRVNGAYYKTLVERIKYAMDLNEKNIFGGVVWIQGEDDAANPSSHFTYFKEMTNQFFSDLSSYANRSITGKIDKSIWFNVETVNYWYTTNAKADGCKSIWNNYKEWNSDTYVEIPSDTKSNTANSTTNTNRVSSTYASHFGENAFEDVVAPCIVKVMTKNYSNHVLPNIDVNDSKDYTLTFNAENITGDKMVLFSENRSIESVTDGTITLNGNISGNTNDPWQWPSKGTNRPHIVFDNVKAMEFEVTKHGTWILLEYDTTNKYHYFLGLNDSYTSNHGIVTGFNGGSTFVNIEQTQSLSKKTFNEGDKVLIVLNDTTFDLYYKPLNENYSVWAKGMKMPNQSGYVKTLGFVYGIANTETPIVSSETNILVKNVRIIDIDSIKETEGYNNNYSIDKLRTSKYITITKDGFITLSDELLSALEKANIKI